MHHILVTLKYTPQVWTRLETKYREKDEKI